MSIQRVVEAMRDDGDIRSLAAGLRARTLWYSLYDLEAGTVDIEFYLGEIANEDGTWQERRSEYLHFALDLS